MHPMLRPVQPKFRVQRPGAGRRLYSIQHHHHHHHHHQHHHHHSHHHHHHHPDDARFSLDRLSHVTTGPVIETYKRKVKSGELTPDPHQEITVKKLQILCNDLQEYEPRFWASRSQKSSFFSSLFSSNNEVVDIAGPRGIYLYGDVGCGKSMLMDLFLESLPIKAKKRVHFNSFMQSLHDSLFAFKMSEHVKHRDGIQEVANSILKDGPLLCFDEFQVTNIADAMIMGRLFDYLWKKGAVVVSTSNRPPDDLYKGGLQRELFLPFIGELKRRCHVHNLNSGTDYRLVGNAAENVYIITSPENFETEINRIWKKLTGDQPGERTNLVSRGRSITVPKAYKGICQFTFEQLCTTHEYGPAECTLIAENYHTILLSGIPKMDITQYNEARRFITFIDELYEHKCKLVCTAAVPPHELYPTKVDPSWRKDENVSVQGEEEIFAFSRTISRLIEMQSTEYLKAPHVPYPHGRV